MGLGVVDGGIAADVQPLRLERLGKVPGVVDDGLLIAVLESVHLVGGHQQTELRAEMVVGDAAGEEIGRAHV